jgi:hypothetical protein
MFPVSKEKILLRFENLEDLPDSDSKLKYHHIDLHRFAEYIFDEVNIADARANGNITFIATELSLSGNHILHMMQRDRLKWETEDGKQNFRFEKDP